MSLPYMSSFSIGQLKRAIKIAEKIERLESDLAAVLGGAVGAVSGSNGNGRKGRKVGGGKRTGRTVSPEVRAKMAAAQKARWAKRQS